MQERGGAWHEAAKSHPILLSFAWVPPSKQESSDSMDFPNVLLNGVIVERGARHFPSFVVSVIVLLTSGFFRCRNFLATLAEPRQWRSASVPFFRLADLLDLAPVGDPVFLLRR